MRMKLIRRALITTLVLFYFYLPTLKAIDSLSITIKNRSNNNVTNNICFGTLTTNVKQSLIFAQQYAELNYTIDSNVYTWNIQITTRNTNYKKSSPKSGLIREIGKTNRIPLLWTVYAKQTNVGAQGWALMGDKTDPGWTVYIRIMHFYGLMVLQYKNLLQIIH